jgi:hypothetical protein
LIETLIFSERNPQLSMEHTKAADGYGESLFGSGILRIPVAAHWEQDTNAATYRRLLVWFVQETPNGIAR